MRWSRTAKMIAAVALGGAAGVVACNAVLDTGKFTYGSCENKGERRCVNNALEVCTAEGTWGAGTPCEGMACNADAGQCVGVCAPDSKQCNPDGSPSVQTCDTTGLWNDGTICLQHACVENRCGSCVPATTSCNETTDPATIRPDAAGPAVILCDTHGVYSVGGQCPCVHGDCRDCLPGETGCLGPEQRTCDDAGHWPDAGTPCDPGLMCDPSAGVGHCVKPCTQGSTQCNGPGEAQTCNANLVWETTEVCQLPCRPCKQATGKCAALAQGTSCTDVCILSGTCQGGMCEPATNGEVPCVGADNGTCNLAVCNKGSCVAPQNTSCNAGLCLDGGSECNSGTCEGVDHAWAHWSFTNLADASNGRFVTTSQVVYDTATKLMWERTPVDTAFNYNLAQTHCDCLDDPSNGNCQHIDGYPSGWRLPTRIELASIVLYSNATTGNPLIDQMSFGLPNMGSDAGATDLPFWSISTQAGTPANGWQVNFKTGLVQPVSISQKALVRCVR